MKTLQAPVDFLLIVPGAILVYYSYELIITRRGIATIWFFLPYANEIELTIIAMTLGAICLVLPIWSLAYTLRSRPVPTILKTLLILFALPSLLFYAFPVAEALLRLVKLQ